MLIANQKQNIVTVLDKKNIKIEILRNDFQTKIMFSWLRFDQDKSSVPEFYEESFSRKLTQKEMAALFIWWFENIKPKNMTFSGTEYIGIFARFLRFNRYQKDNF